jgi:aerobic-type carbon monoxide dehydrogenase small subunit (CoxS/CutS family)
MADQIELHVNGETRRVDSAPGRTLLDVLREDLGLTGCKPGCGEGACGACTVLVDRRPVRACVAAPVDMVGQPILTIEGLAGDRSWEIGDRGEGLPTDAPTSNSQSPTPNPRPLHPLQQAFLDADAMQCGYCTPGMIMAALGLLHQQPSPTEQAIVEAMNGNICRCGAYARIVAAIQQAASTMRGEL